MAGHGTLRDLLEILTFQAGYNTAVVLAGATMLGAAAGLVGAVVLLRKRALMSDSISHSTLPGVGLAFLAGIALGGTGREMPLLMAGAALTAALGVLSVQWIRVNTRLGEDAAIGTVLSVYYGAGIVLMSVIQGLDVGSQAGLNGFLLGAVASLRLTEAWTIAAVSGAAILITLLVLKELLMMCFDREFAAAGGWPVGLLDLLLMGLLLTIVSVGLKTVGMVLIIAIVIIPAVAARFWTNRAGRLLGVAAGIGAASAMIGVSISAIVPHAPTGAIIVLTAGGFFALSMAFGRARGLAFSAVRILVWRFRVWDCQILGQARGGSPVEGWRGLLFRLRGLVDGRGHLTARGAARAAHAEADLLDLDPWHMMANPPRREEPA